MSRTRRFRLLVVVLLALCIVCYLALLRTPRKAVVLLSAYEVDGLRPTWLRTILGRYTSNEYAQVVEKVVLVWNEPNADPPKDLPKGVEVVLATNNSLNNRWTLAAPRLTNSPVIVADNDLFLSPAALRCLLTVQKDNPELLLGPYVRRRDGEEYVLDELVTHASPYHFVLPRAMLASPEVVALYGTPELLQHRSYVDSQAAHCDDLLFNLVAGASTGSAPLRVALPPASVSDFSTVCGPLDRANSAGLADQSNRATLRSECLRHFLDSPPFSTNSSRGRSQIALCSDDGRSYSTADRVTLKRWRAMASATAADLCPELLLDANVALPLEGQAGELSEYCPAVDKATSEWLLAVSRLPVCGEANAQPDDGLFQSGKYQCAAWCVWDLRSPGRVGWHLESLNTCWRRFENGHVSCDEWYSSKPKITLS
ncbi:hypothetical protein JCM8547_005045 [Rhodosporidiobolus lusitaniae]